MGVVIGTFGKDWTGERLFAWRFIVYLPAVCLRQQVSVHRACASTANEFESASETTFVLKLWKICNGNYGQARDMGWPSYRRNGRQEQKRE